ncbi:hypothetical protein PC116_g16654 [Phytophthora cactorum]|nr:hypothetical protein PC111_g25359 [Phytophthora cactorum]KAG4235194.1 hypothetical protein PC116_g16654 [Phytophthora cactorum]
MVIAIAKYFGWPLDQLDVVTAFLYGVMKEVVYCVVPEGVDLDGDFDCLELVKAIYGLKQASRVERDLRRVRVLHRLSSFGLRPVPLHQGCRWPLCARAGLRGRCIDHRKFTRADLTHEERPQDTLRND